VELCCILSAHLWDIDPLRDDLTHVNQLLQRDFDLRKA